MKTNRQAIDGRRVCGQWRGRRGRARILRSILRPSDRYAPQYMMWVVITTDGEAHEGVQLDHKAGGAIDLYTTEERKEHFDASEIAAYEVSRRSLMPDGLEESLTVTDLRDLLAFLESPR